MQRSAVTRLTLAVSLCLTACGDPAQPTATPSAPRQFAPLLLEHDFGIVPHGEQRSHEFELDLTQLADLVPLRVHLECSCGRADVRLRNSAGEDRFVDGSGYARNLPSIGERAFLHVELDTRKREPIDLPLTTSHGYILLQPVDDDTGMARVRWPFALHFGVDAPVDLQPFASFDFGRVPESRDIERITSLRGDERHAAARFTDVRSSDPGLEVSLQPAEDHVVVRAVCHPGALGNHRATITIDSDLPDYVLTLEATWKVVPDLEAVPVAKVSISASLDQPQGDDAGNRQFVLLRDHDLQRAAEFVVDAVVDGDGRDASSHFAIAFAPVPGQDRQQRMSVRYLGGLTAPMRGKIVLAKPGGGPELPIELVLLPARHP